MAIVIPTEDVKPNTLELFTTDLNWDTKMTIGIKSHTRAREFQLPTSIARAPLEMCGLDSGRGASMGKDGNSSAKKRSICDPVHSTLCARVRPSDYILMFLNEGKRSASLQHGNSNGVSVPFAKIILYPLPSGRKGWYPKKQV